MIAKPEANGSMLMKTLWAPQMSRSFTVCAILLLGNFCVVAQSFDSLWARSYGGTGTEWGFAVGERSDGKILLAGSTSSFGAGGSDGYLMCVDGEGIDAWVPSYYGGSFNEYFFDIAILPNNDFFLAGQKEISDSNANGWVMKFSASGSPIYAWQEGSTGAEVFKQVVATPDGGCLACGTQGSAGAERIYIVKFTANLDTQWTKILRPTYSATGNFIRLGPDGSYVFGGSNTTSGNHFILGKLSATGDSLWMYQYAGLGSAASFDAVAEQHRIIVCGFASVTGTFQGARMRVIQTTTDGFIIGTPTDIADSSGCAYKILPCGAGRYVLSGWSASTATLNQSSLTMIDENFTIIDQKVFEGFYYGAGACIRQTSPLQVAVAGTMEPEEAAVMMVNTGCFTSAAEPKEVPTAIDTSSSVNEPTSIRQSIERPAFHP